MFRSVGRLRYSINQKGDFNLVVDADQGIVDYYRALMPKYIRTNRQAYDAHISVVRKEIPVKLENWAKYQGRSIEFEYENVVRWGTVYYWLDVYCVELESIRRELGLDITSEYTRPPDGFSHCFHMTIGNTKVLK